MLWTYEKRQSTEERTKVVGQLNRSGDDRCRWRPPSQSNTHRRAFLSSVTKHHKSFGAPPLLVRTSLLPSHPLLFHSSLRAIVTVAPLSVGPAGALPSRRAEPLLAARFLAGRDGTLGQPHQHGCVTCGRLCLCSHRRGAACPKGVYSSSPNCCQTRVARLNVVDGDYCAVHF